MVHHLSLPQDFGKTQHRHDLHQTEAVTNDGKADFLPTEAESAVGYSDCLPAKHPIPSFPILIIFKPRIARHKLLQYWIELVLGAWSAFKSIHDH